jgi:adenine-specific DNA-methyltransferase
MTLSEEDEAGKWDTFWRGTDRETMRYSLFGQTPETGQWRWKKKRADQAQKNYDEYLANFSSTMSLDDFYYLRTQEIGTDCEFVRLNDEGVVQYYVSPRNYRLMSDVWMRLATAGNITSFPHEKNLELVETAIRWVTSDHAIVLDSFAGSGSTAHAVLSANRKDRGSRKFILVEMEDYEDELPASRIRDAIRSQHDGGLLLPRDESFTYCTLGDPVEMDAILSGGSLPDVDAMAGLLWHTATAMPFEPRSLMCAPDLGEGVMRIGTFGGRTFWMIYRSDLGWLKSGDAALSLAKARAIAATATGNHLVFAPAKFVSRELLARERIDLDYAPLPFALYRLETA